MTPDSNFAEMSDELRRDECRRKVRAHAELLQAHEHRRVELEQELAYRLLMAKAAGIGVPELARLIGSTRQHVYRQIRRAQQ